MPDHLYILQSNAISLPFSLEYPIVAISLNITKGPKNCKNETGTDKLFTVSSITYIKKIDGVNFHFGTTFSVFLGPL